MNNEVLQAVRFSVYRVGGAEVSGARPDGSPEVKFATVERERGELFVAPPEVAARLIAEGHAKKALLSDKLAALAAAVLAVETPLAAALAGLSVPGVRPWHATRQGAHWCPAPVALGPGRGGFSARFAEAAEARARWAEKPDAVPLFSFATPHGFDRAFIWRQRGLLEIATEIQHLGRN